MVTEKYRVDLDRSLTEFEKQFLDRVVEKYPPTLTRKEMSSATGGWLNSNSLREYERRGLGPKGVFRDNRNRYIYDTELLCEWWIRVFGLKKDKRKK